MKRRGKTIRIKVKKTGLYKGLKSELEKLSLLRKIRNDEGEFLEVHLTDIAFVYYNYAAGKFPYPRGETPEPKEIKRIVKKFNESSYHFILKFHFKNTYPIKTMEIDRKNDCYTIS